jgi:hypothetical protein
LYTVAYRPVRRGQPEKREEIDLWPVGLRVGDALPELPLVLNWEVSLPVDLETTYMEVCRRRRLT